MNIEELTDILEPRKTEEPKEISFDAIHNMFRNTYYINYNSLYSIQTVWYNQTFITVNTG